MVKRNRFWSFFRLSRLRRRAAARLAPAGLQSGLAVIADYGTISLRQFDGGPTIFIHFDERKHALLAIGFLTGDY